MEQIHICLLNNGYSISYALNFQYVSYLFLVFIASQTLVLNQGFRVHIFCVCFTIQFLSENETHVIILKWVVVFEYFYDPTIK